MSENTTQVNSAKLRFDGTVHFGHLLIIMGFIGSAAFAYNSIQQDLSNHEWRITNNESALKEQNRINSNIQESLSSIGRDIAIIRTKVDRVEGTVSPTNPR